MARTKQTARSRLITPATRTWTRFCQAPDREWPPAWPFSGTGNDNELHLGPLADVAGIEDVWIGRMVDSPEEAVYIINWARKERKEEEFVDLERFWGSHACWEFLENLPESRHQIPPSPRTSVKATERCKRRFVVLKLDAGYQYHDMRGRVTLTAFLVPVCEKAAVEGDESSGSDPYEGIRKVFGDNQLLPEYVDMGMWYHHTTWWLGPVVSVSERPNGSEQEGQNLSAQKRLEGYLLGDLSNAVDNVNGAEGSEVDDETKGSSNQEVVICEFRKWQTARSSNRRLEEKASKDVEARQEWDETITDMQGRGLVKAWKKERWDIRSAPDAYSYDPIDEQEYEHSEYEE